MSNRLLKSRVVFHDIDVPVAAAMVQLTQNNTCLSFEPFQSYICYWTAFNNIYIKLGESRNIRPAFQHESDGRIKRQQRGCVRVPKVQSPRESDYLDAAFHELTDEVKDALLHHDSVTFFAERKPQWQGHRIVTDSLGQKLNGVINVGYTIDRSNPVWSPIDQAQYQSYQNNGATPEIRDALARQVYDILYAVRNNTFHGGKSPDEPNDATVVQNALPLLKIVVHSFLRD